MNKILCLVVVALFIMGCHVYQCDPNENIISHVTVNKHNPYGDPDSIVDLLIQEMRLDEGSPSCIDYADSVYKLIEIGPPAVPKLLQVMIDGDEITRMRAENALHGIIRCQYGFRDGIGWMHGDRSKDVYELYRSLGPLSWKDDIEHRRQAVRLWYEWWRKNQA